MALSAQIRDFIKDVAVESKRVSWPTRQELRDSTLVVIIFVILLTAFVWVVDSILRMALGLLFR